MAGGNKLYLIPIEELTAMVEAAGLVVEHSETVTCTGDYSDRGLGKMSRAFDIVVARKTSE